MTTTTADPRTLAELAAATPRPLLVAFDCDGVLSPIVEHADDAVLLPGRQLEDGPLQLPTTGQAPKQTRAPSTRIVFPFMGFFLSHQIEACHGLPSPGRPKLLLECAAGGRSAGLSNPQLRM